jgi:hypothetical protein
MYHSVHGAMYISYSEWSETRRCYIGIGFQLCFRLCPQEGPVKSRRIGTEQNTSDTGLSNNVNVQIVNINNIKNTEALLESNRKVGLELNTEETKYEGRLKSSWTHLITLSQNFVEVR